MISNSLEWSNIEIDLMRKANKLGNKADLSRMINNIRKEVTELSKAEVVARRGPKYEAIDRLNRINQDIELIEEYILVAALIG